LLEITRDPFSARVFRIITTVLLVQLADVKVLIGIWLLTAKISFNSLVATMKRNVECIRKNFNGLCEKTISPLNVFYYGVSCNGKVPRQTSNSYPYNFYLLETPSAAKLEVEGFLRHFI